MTRPGHLPRRPASPALHHHLSGRALRVRPSLNGRREQHRHPRSTTHHYTPHTMIRQIEGYIPVETSEGSVLIPESAWEGVRSVIEDGFGGAFTVHVQVGVVEGPDGEPRQVPYYSLDIAAEESAMQPLFDRITPLINDLVEQHVQQPPHRPPAGETPGPSIRAAIRNTLTPPESGEALPLAS